MFKNQLQELAQRSCFNLPTYTCIREGPDHAPRFKAFVNFNGETFETPSFSTTLRQAEHAAAEVALNYLSNRGPPHSLAARILDETGVYKNLLQEVSQRVGASLPMYTTIRSGTGHQPVFTCTVEVAGIVFTGEPAKNKKQAEKNAAMTAWFSLKQLAQESPDSTSLRARNDELEHVTVARALQNYLDEVKKTNPSFPIELPVQKSRPPSVQLRPVTPVCSSKILPSIHPKTLPSNHPKTPGLGFTILKKPTPPSQSAVSDRHQVRSHKFPAAKAVPYVPIRQWRPCRGIAPPVTVRNVTPVYAAPLRPLPAAQSPQIKKPLVNGTPRVLLRRGMEVYTAPSVPNKISTFSDPTCSSCSSTSEEDIGRLPQEKENLQISVVLETRKERRT